MVDFRLLNAKPRATLIQRFDGSLLLLGPRGEAKEFNRDVPLYEIQDKVEELGWAIGVTHLHKAVETIAFQVLSLGKNNLRSETVYHLSTFNEDTNEELPD